MRKAAKRLLTFVICCIFCGIFCLFSSALSTNEYGLGLTADSQEANGSASVRLSLKNSNSFDVSDIKITYKIPDGLELKSEAADKDSNGIVIPVGNLAAGNTYSAELVFAAIDSPVITGSEPATAVSKTNEKAVIAAVIAAAVIIATVIVFARKHKKTAAMLLALVMLIPIAGVFGVHAVGADETRSFTLNDFVAIGGKKYPLSFTVSYTASTAKNNYFELETADKNSETVNRSVADFSGTAVANSTVMSVTYEVRSDIDDFEVGSSGTSALDGCEWSIDNLALKHGENKVTFTATLANGETQTQVHSIYYDQGELYSRTAAEEAEENGTKYVKEIVNIYFDIDTTDERIAEILDEIGAERVGEANDIVMVQARVEAESLDALNKKCEEIEKYDEVTAAGIEQILPLNINTVTNDPWNTYVSYKETRNEEIPDGYNWHVEAIQAHSAWDYQQFFGKATVGIIDGPVMTDHEDMSGKVKFADSYESDNVFSTVAKDKADQFHGTHVASIIGATQNNSLGIAGLLQDVDIYAANFGAASNTISYIVSAVSSQVTNGAKAVNLSLGLSNTTGSNPYLNPYSTSDLDSTARQCAVGMSSLIQSGKEFVVVQSAGNGVIDTRLGSNMYRSVDATQNGLYCSVRTDGSYGSLTLSQIQAVYDRIIIVGAAENDSNVSKYADFTMYYRSNAGSRVDIYAPGYRIMGATTPQADSKGEYTIMYGMATGTSQAAPQVAAVAALCFAINPNLTGAQVKTMIKENTRCDVKDNTQTQKGTDNVYYELHPATGNGRMLSMKLVAEAAMRTVVGKANYTQLNRIVAAAQSLDPNTFTNYEIVQAVIDSIDYNLYAYQQDEVDAKYIELLDAMDKLIERTPADYSEVEKAKAEAAALNPDDYVDFSGVTSAVNAVVYGKYSDEQAQVDSMAQTIRDAISSLVAKAELITLDPSIVPDNRNRVVVLTSDYLETYTECINASGGYTLSFEPNSFGTYSTGADIKMSKDGCDDIVYTVAVLGDIDGNGKADANDAFLARMCANGMLDLTHTAYTIAADANCDGEITEDDFILIQNCAIFNDFIFNDYTPGE